MKRILHTVLTICLALPVLAGEPEHFSLAYSGNGTNHMNFYFLEATIGGEDLEAGDEIAVFDGEVCAGAVRLDGTLPSTAPYLQIAASKAEPGETPPNGYTEGNAISVKIWDASNQAEYEADLVFFNTNNKEIDPVPFAEGTSAFLKIAAPVPVTIGLTAEDKVYDGDEAANVDYVVSEGSFSGDVNVTITNGAFNDKNVGQEKPVTADMEVTGEDVVHYDFTLNESTTASISAKPVSITGAEAQNKTYDGTAAATITGAQLSGVLAEDDVTLSGATSGTFTQTAVGTGIVVTTSMQLSGADAGNYSLTGQPSGLTADITKAPLTVTADDQEKTYDGESFSGFTASYSGFVDGEGPDDLEGTLAFATNPRGPVVESGTWEIIPSGLSSDNYAITFENGELKIKKATLTVTADNKTKDYDGQVFSPFTASFSGFVNNEDETVISGAVDYTGNAINAVNAGNYLIIPVTDDLNAVNYAFTAEEGKLTINKVNARITVNGFDGAYDGLPHGATGNATGVNGESLEGLDLGRSYVNVPGGNVNWRFNDRTGNYYNATGTVSINITKANAGIELSGLSQAYSGAPLPVTVATTPSGLAVNVTYDGQDEAPVETGEYTVLAVVEDQNYQGSAEGTLTIGDETSPEINASDISELTIVCGAEYQEQLQQWLEENAGATASDDTGVEGWSYDFDPEDLSALCGIKDTSITITFTAEDGHGNKTTVTSVLHVKINEGPFLVNPLPDQVIHASYELSIPLSSVSGEIFDDVNDPFLSLEAMVEGTDTLPGWAQLLNDTLFITPVIADTGCVNIVAKASDSYGATATDTFQVCVDGYPTGLEQPVASQPEVNLYPNPTRDKVTLKLNGTVPATGVELIVLNIAGQQVLRKHFSAAQQITFSMANHVSGMYFVQLKFKDKRITKKMILDLE